MSNDHGHVLARWRAGDRFASLALRHTLATSGIVGAILVVVGLVASWGATHLIGGAQHVVPHFYYAPILFAAVRFGPVAALATAVASGVLAGPFTPLDVAMQTTQETQRWVTRAVFFATIGVGMAALVRPGLPSFSDEIRNLRSARAVRDALRRGELFVRYQPIVDMRTGDLYGAEALVRWDHSQRGELSPAEFLGAAEASGAIRDIDAFVLETACRQAAEWRSLAEANGVARPCVTVNMSVADLESPDLISRIRDTLESTGVDPAQICLEVTESMLVDDFDVSAARLAGLKTLGVQIAIDDFGSGYSSLSAVHRFPADVLKIDRMFLRSMGRDPHADQLIGGIALLARSLEVTLIAEGVETAEQRDQLLEYGYEIAQGFHYARPLTPDDVSSLLESPRPFDAAVADPRRAPRQQAHHARPHPTE